MKIKLSERERWILFIMIAVVIIYFMSRFVFSPIYSRIAAQRNAVKQNEAELRLIKQQVTFLGDISVVPVTKVKSENKEQQIIKAIHYLSSEISKAQLDLRSIAPRPEEASVLNARAIIIDLRIEGEYNAIYRFIYSIERLPILIVPSSILLSGIPDSTKLTAVLSLMVFY